MFNKYKQTNKHAHKYDTSLRIFFQKLNLENHEETKKKKKSSISLHQNLKSLNYCEQEEKLWLHFKSILHSNVWSPAIIIAFHLNMNDFIWEEKKKRNDMKCKPLTHTHFPVGYLNDGHTIASLSHNKGLKAMPSQGKYLNGQLNKQIKSSTGAVQVS